MKNKILSMVVFVIFSAIGCFWIYSQNYKDNAISSSGDSATTRVSSVQPYDNLIYETEKNDTKKLEHPGDLSDILKRGKLVVCALKNDQNAVYQVKTSNGYAGEDVRIASELGKVLGVKVLYRMVYETNDDVVDAVNRGEGDLGLADLSYTDERAKKVLFTEPYVVLQKVLLVNRVALTKKPGASLERLLDRKDVNIAVMKGTSYERFAKKLFPKAKIHAETDWMEGAVKKLEEGKVVSIFRSSLRMGKLLADRPQISMHFVPLVLKGEKDTISAVTNINSPAFVLFINNFLKNNYEILTVEELQKLYQKLYEEQKI